MTKVTKALGQGYVCTDRINCGKFFIQPPCNCPSCPEPNKLHGEIISCPYCTRTAERKKEIYVG